MSHEQGIRLRVGRPGRGIYRHSRPAAGRGESGGGRRDLGSWRCGRPGYSARPVGARQGSPRPGESRGVGRRAAPLALGTCCGPWSVARRRGVDVRPLKIAITADPYLPVPPKLYGGIERVIDFLVRGLVARGHEITLFAHPESHTDGRLVPYGVPPHSGTRARLAELWQVGAGLWRDRAGIDLVHSFGRLAALAPVLPIRRLPKIQSYQRAAVPWRGVRSAARLAGDSVRFTACSSSVYWDRPGSDAGTWHTVFNGVP